jgi:hypothetical protein
MNLETTVQPSESPTGRLCLRPAIPEIGIAAGYLDEAVSAHLANQHDLAKQLIIRANEGEIRAALIEWIESISGKASPYTQYRKVEEAPARGKAQRTPYRAPTPAEKRLLHERDGYCCRFCGIPVIRREVRERFRKLYGGVVVPWGNTAKELHAALRVMWAQYDHILPRSRGGNDELNNIVITCAPCNYGRGDYTLAEAGLIDPRARDPIQSPWDGLERLLHHPK